MAKEELFRKKWFGKLLRSLGTFPVKRGQNDTESIRKALDILTQGEALLIFPEGIRGNGIQLNPINPGVAMLAKRTGAQILPVGIIGTHIAWPAGAKKIQRAPMTVIFGKPFSYEEVAQGTTEREKREHFSSELSQRILELCRQGGLELQAPFSGALPVEN
jgi:1-acyl-sn-glycerol-3-phosphate acyltransferase